MLRHESRAAQRSSQVRHAEVISLQIRASAYADESNEALWFSMQMTVPVLLSDPFPAEPLPCGLILLMGNKNQWTPHLQVDSAAVVAEV